MVFLNSDVCNTLYTFTSYNTELSEYAKVHVKRNNTAAVYGFISE